MDETRSVLFVCRANICRSPMAEFIFNDLAEERGLSVSASSAGVEAWEGYDMAPNTRAVLDEMGFSSDKHRSRRVTEEMLGGSNLVLTMNRKHTDAIRMNFGDEAEVLTLPEFAGDRVEPDISDPYRLTVHAYRATVRRILGYVEISLEKLAKS